ncbi:uncharacterized protein KD926_009759 [Aspergillus affinis]|uniref:uncharacterized protein n=1 Tax=Aspergillus affinis TaxID=1070780 RepID=UPI0022FE68BC|nr:uncharacterized protein KD926_009759 [Aspergillus affinis]KAI9039317.1 hypothetical protein KD926_009759 [Aspergillus affinis]
MTSYPQALGVALMTPTARYTKAGYDNERNQVFINLDSSNLKAPMKPLISKAISTSKRQDLTFPTIRSDPTFPLSLSTLDLSAGEFRSHFITLWGNFHSVYACTPDVWSSGISSAGLQNRALDLALIALATMRLSLSPEHRDNNYQVFSLSAYNTSIQIFRRLLQDKPSMAKSKTVLVVISLVFTLFEAVQQRPTQIYDSGWAGHLKGALALMERQGPGSFQNGALHEAFRKLREMAVFTLLRLSPELLQSSFLSQEEWMTVPWKEIKKAHRDKLYDIAAKLASIYSRLPSTTACQLPHVEEGFNLTWRCQQLYEDLMNWRTEWLRSEHPEFLISSPSHRSKATSHCSVGDRNSTYTPDPRTFPTNEFSFLVAESTALVLLLNNMVTRLAISTSDPSMSDTNNPSPESLTTSISTSLSPPISTLTSTAHYTLRLRPFSPETYELQTYLRSALELPCFGYSSSTFDEAGITEGRCRSLLPNWVLSNVYSDGVETWAEEDGDLGTDPGADWSDASWWGGLSDRLNFGVF